MSTNAATLVVFTLLGAFLPGSSFVQAPVAVPRGQAHHSRRPSRFSTPLPSAQQEPPPPLCFSTRQRSWRASSRAGAALPPLSVSSGEIDDIDPLEAGPDPVEDEPAQDYEGDETADAEEDSESDEVKEDDADAVAMAGVAAAVKHTEAKLRKTKTRKRIDPFMPRGAPPPVEWAEVSDLEIGCRAHLVIFHTGFPEDQAIATDIVNRVKARFGGLVNVQESYDQDEDTTEEERRKSNAFEVWLEGLDYILYHARGECEAEITEEIIVKMLDDIQERIRDDAPLGVYVHGKSHFPLAGLTYLEQKFKERRVL